MSATIVGITTNKMIRGSGSISTSRIGINFLAEAYTFKTSDTDYFLGEISSSKTHAEICSSLVQNIPSKTYSGMMVDLAEYSQDPGGVTSVVIRYTGLMYPQNLPRPIVTVDSVTGKRVWPYRVILQYITEYGTQFGLTGVKDSFSKYPISFRGVSLPQCNVSPFSTLDSANRRIEEEQKRINNPISGAIPVDGVPLPTQRPLTGSYISFKGIGLNSFSYEKYGKYAEATAIFEEVIDTINLIGTPTS